MKHLLAVLLLALSFAAPVYGQSEATPEATPIVVDSGTPVEIVIEQPPEPLIDNDTILAIGALLLAGVSVVVSLTRGGSLDKSLTVQLQLIQSNREAMTAYERQYLETSVTVRQVFDTLTTIVRAIAPLTPITTDDTLGDTLEDVRTPGAPSSPSAFSQPKRED